MKRILAISLIVTSFCFASFAAAQDVVLEKTIQNIMFKKSKAGNEFARVMINEKATLNGISYNKQVGCVAFDGEIVKKLKSYRKGQVMKAIASEGEYKGSKSYVILEVVK